MHWFGSLAGALTTAKLLHRQVQKHNGASKKANPETSGSKPAGAAAAGIFDLGFRAGEAANAWLNELRNAAKAVMDYVRGKCCAGYAEVEKAAAAVKRAIVHLIRCLFNSNDVADDAGREIDRAAGQANDISAAPLLELRLPANPEPQALAALKAMADQARPVAEDILKEMLSVLADTELKAKIPAVAKSCIVAIEAATEMSVHVFEYVEDGSRQVTTTITKSTTYTESSY